MAEHQCGDQAGGGAAHMRLPGHARLVRQANRQPYLVAVNRRLVERALEFFVHNLQLQQGLTPAPPKRRKAMVKKLPLTTT